jgi:hypothetical protein
MKHNFKNKTYLLFGVVSLLCIGILYFSYGKLCDDIRCEVAYLTRVLDPALKLAIAIAIAWSFFLFLPIDYFKAWLKYILSWALPFSVLIVATTDPLEQGVLGSTPTQVAQLLSIFFGVVTLVFLFLRWSWLQKRSGKETK